ncbi:KAP family NTPase [Algoriphagus sp. AGSA1]|uniref:KAP family P-loop NTPase fold protein n=1 Tax=Algoriphagus sp. AGSA1 TaxID=2907213 RepID=UPI001F3ABF24|nr:P-loop NTPase fold protein [Algoriphagus sp. AGSA1]MCE7053892.1 KAP family NTPase [Algoriphagus sp. AGSA1]
MWSDNESLSDYIDYSHLLNAVTGIIDNPDLLPCSIGIYGDWGSGKSSLMKMVEHHYEDNKDVLVIRFNGWLFEGYEDAKTVLMASIVDEIIAKRTFTEKALKSAAKLLKRIDWIKAAGTASKHAIAYATMGPLGSLSIAATEAIAKLKDVDYESYIKAKQEKKEGDPDDTLRSNIQEFHKNFEDLISETKIAKIIVLIDDLDRCSPDTVIGTLEAIKLFLFTKNTAFVIGADERLIKYSVKRRFPEVPGDNMEVGRDYLEKLIQFPIRIPELNTVEMTTYINLLFAKLYVDDELFEKMRSEVILAKQAKGFDFMFDQTNLNDFFASPDNEFVDAIALCSQVVPVLSRGLNGNPRQTKRFLNTLLIRMQMGGSKGMTLKRRMLAKLMLLEYFKPETFSSFHDFQAKNNGLLTLLAPLEHFDLKEGEQTGLNEEQKLLLEDLWLSDWVKSEPKLSGENLQPYFYFSREKLGITAVNLQRMTPKAQEVLQGLLSESQTIQNNTLKTISAVSGSEAASVFEALTQKIRQGESSKENTAPLKMLIELCRLKPELISQLITFLSKVNEKTLPLTTVTMAEGLLKTSHPQQLKTLLKKWSGSENKRLSNLAKTKIEK